MKHILLGIMMALSIVACTPPAKPAVRHDGHYRQDVGGLVYLIRFFPDGRAVLINGMADVQDTLPHFLKAGALGDPAMGWYNVPLRTQGDSLFFTTRAEKGELDYRGVVVNDTLVRFERYSHINGDRSIKAYRFLPDAPASQ